MLIYVLLMLAAIAGTVLMTVLSVRAVVRLGIRSRPFVPRPLSAGDSPRDGSSVRCPKVSILKPLCGLDDGLEENLASFAGLDGVSYELIGSVERTDDPAVEVFRRIQARFPSAPFSLVIGGASGRTLNPKIDRLIPALAAARGQIIFVSDSNVRVGKDQIARTLAPLAEGAADAVSNPFAGTGARDTGSFVECLHLLNFVVPGNLLAGWSGRPCLVGKSFAVVREALEKIGGFERFRNVLAEDQAIALALYEAGFRLVYSEEVVENIIERRTLRRALKRQIRWGQIRISFSTGLFTGEFLMNPFPVSILAAMVGLMAGVSAPLCVSLPVLVALARIGQTVLLDASTGGRLPSRALWFVPLADLLQFGTQFVPYFTRAVDWNGHRARLGPGTVMLPLGPGISPNSVPVT
jgi:ceramide glucosyltransferase